MTMAPMDRPGVIPEWTLSDRLRKARESAGLEQVELAHRTKISRATISAAENGHRLPSRATMLLWALATGTNPAWLERGTEGTERSWRADGVK